MRKGWKGAKWLWVLLVSNWVHYSLNLIWSSVEKAKGNIWRKQRVRCASSQSFHEVWLSDSQDSNSCWTSREETGSQSHLSLPSCGQLHPYWGSWNWSPRIEVCQRISGPGPWQIIENTWDISAINKGHHIPRGGFEEIGNTTWSAPSLQVVASCIMGSTFIMFNMHCSIFWKLLGCNGLSTSWIHCNFNGICPSKWFICEHLWVSSSYKNNFKYDV